MKTNIAKLLVIVILVGFFLITFSNIVYADGTTTTKKSAFSITNIFDKTKAFFEQGSSGSNSGSEIGQEMASEIQPIINTIYWVGVAVVIGAAMFLGIEYFKTSGDPKERATIQGKLIGFLISSVVLIAAYPIWKFVIGAIGSLIGF